MPYETLFREVSDKPVVAELAPTIMQESGQITAHIRQPKHLIHAKEILFDHR
jgi:hypothetical protein